MSASYYFWPAVRRGLARVATAMPSGERALLDIALDITGDGTPSSATLKIGLYGPGDVVGFEAGIVARTDPQPDVGDFEPNFFASIEFADCDFPWRFTPGVDENGRWQPWITLIVLRTDEFALPPSAEGAPPRLELTPTAVLPDLREGWRWAHAQVAGSRGSVPDLAAVESQDTERAVSRLISARRLAPGTAYQAFVVPTFRLGVLAAGIDVPGAATGVTFAWPGTTMLPYYYSWKFRTGARGDFEYLVRLLEPRVLEKLGLRDMDCSAPGYGGVPAPLRTEPDLDPAQSSVLAFEGALRSLETEFTKWGHDQTLPTAQAFQSSLARLVNSPLDDVTRNRRLGAASDEVVRNVDASIVPPAASDGAGVEMAVVLRWTTTRPAGCTVEHGPTATYGGSIPSPLGTTHEIRFPVSPRATWQLRIAWTGADGTSGVTPPASVDTPLAIEAAVVPPAWGRWYATSPRVRPLPSSGTWSDALNLDPRHRGAAGFGAVVVEAHQEAFVASILDQIGATDDANQLLRHAQFGREASNWLFKRLLRLAGPSAVFPLSTAAVARPTALLHATAPVHARVATGSGASRTSVGQKLRDSGLPAGALDPALRRILRLRGPIRKRQGVTPRQTRPDLLTRLLSGPLGLPTTRPPFGTGLEVCDVSEIAKRLPGSMPTGRTPPTGGRLPTGGGIYDAGLTTGVRTTTGGLVGTTPRFGTSLGTAATVVGGSPPVLGTVTTPPVTLPPIEFCGPAISAQEVARALNDPVASGALIAQVPELRQAAQALVSCLNDGWLKHPAPPPARTAPPPSFLPSLAVTVAQALDPVQAVRKRVMARLDLAASVSRAGDPLGPLVASADLPQPMYVPLREISQDLILPGVEKVPQNTLGLLLTNTRFVESYMVGINHSLTAELRWRSAPTGMRTTWARQFWEPLNLSPAAAEAAKDIAPVRNWARALGANAGNGGQGALVLLVRGELLKKYPNTVIYAVKGDAAGKPALPEFTGGAPANIIRPLFTGTLPPDLTFFGWPFQEEDARGRTPGYVNGLFFVIEERIGEPRFGIDEGPASTATLNDWNDLAWGQLPVAENAYVNATTPANAAATPPWADSSVNIADILFQPPVRIVVDVRRMLPKE